MINIDADPENADWTKTTPDLPTTKEELLAFFERSGTTPEHFNRLMED